MWWSLECFMCVCCEDLKVGREGKLVKFCKWIQVVMDRLIFDKIASIKGNLHNCRVHGDGIPEYISNLLLDINSCLQRGGADPNGIPPGKYQLFDFLKFLAPMLAPIMFDHDPFSSITSCQFCRLWIPYGIYITLVLILVHHSSFFQTEDRYVTKTCL